MEMYNLLPSCQLDKKLIALLCSGSASRGQLHVHIPGPPPCTACPTGTSLGAQQQVACMLGVH